MNRQKLRREILKEFKMMGMADMGSLGTMGITNSMKKCPICRKSSCVCNDYPKDFSSDMDYDFEEETADDEFGEESFASHSMVKNRKGNVSREDCCAAIMCMIECCECEITKNALIECCESILSGEFDQ